MDDIDEALCVAICNLSHLHNADEVGENKLNKSWNIKTYRWLKLFVMSSCPLTSYLNMLLLPWFWHLFYPSTVCAIAVNTQLFKLQAIVWSLQTTGKEYINA